MSKATIVCLVSKVIEYEQVDGGSDALDVAIDDELDTLEAAGFKYISLEDVTVEGA